MIFSEFQKNQDILSTLTCLEIQRQKLWSNIAFFDTLADTDILRHSQNDDQPESCGQRSRQPASQSPRGQMHWLGIVIHPNRTWSNYSEIFCNYYYCFDFNLLQGDLSLMQHFNIISRIMNLISKRYILIVFQIRFFFIYGYFLQSIKSYSSEISSQ